MFVFRIKKNKNKNKKMIVRFVLSNQFILPILFKAMFEYLYLHSFSETYAYLGSYASPNPIKCFFSWIVFLGLYLGGMCLPNNNYKMTWNLFMVFSIISSLSIYWLKDESTGAFLLISLYWFVWLLTTAYISSKKENFDGQQTLERGYVPRSDNPLIVILYLWVIITTLYISFRYGNFRLFVSLDEVSTYRQSITLPTVLSYLFSWNTNVFLPFLLIVHLLKRKYAFCALDFLLVFLSYAVRGNRIILFSGFLIFSIYILKRMRVEEYIDKFIYAVLLFFLALVVIIPKSKIGLIPGSIAYRLVSFPAEAHYYYYDFFTNYSNDFLYLRQSIFRLFTENPYSEAVSVIIGSSTNYYLTGRYSNSNNGLFSDAFQNFGVLGVIIYPIIIIFTLRFFFKCIKCYDRSIQYSMLLMTVYFLVCAYYFTWYFTGGLVPLILLCVLIKCVENRKV